MKIMNSTPYFGEERPPKNRTLFDKLVGGQGTYAFSVDGKTGAVYMDPAIVAMMNGQPSWLDEPEEKPERAEIPEAQEKPEEQ